MIFPPQKTEPLRSSMPFVVSGWVHGFLLAWVALSPGSGPAAPRSLYEQEIQPHEKRIIWYSVRDRLPDISPTGAHKDPQPPRAREKFNQTIVAGAKDLPGPRQMISMPAPEIKTPEPLPLPNVVSVSPPPRPLRPFTAPVEKRVQSATVSLPEATRVTTTVDTRSMPFETRVPKPEPRAFDPPPPVRPKTPAPTALPEAPIVTASVQGKKLPLALPDPRAPRRGFTPPPVAQPKKSAPAALPEAPNVTASVQGKNLPLALPDPHAPPRAFTPPPASRPKAQASTALPEAPGVTAAVHDKNLPFALPDPRAPLRGFTPPPASSLKAAPQPEMPAAPEVVRSASSGPSEVSLAIVGMNPAKAPDFPTPPGSRQAGFSAGPEIRPNGSDGGGNGSSAIEVPGLLVRGGAKDNQPTLAANASPTSRESLLAAARTALSTPPSTSSVAGQPHATRVSSAPDPRLNGRAIYTVAIQMPNVTSYSGSWIVWFAEHEPQPGAPSHDVRPPVPLRKVDPKYIAAAAAEKVEGTVRLFAVIRKDGHVESVALLKHLDDRLDRSAQEALAQWIFQPALLDGSPMDVDAVFEIPFRLAPKLDN
jgi:TonB family protein